MKTAWLGLGVGFLAFACGGDDSTIANPQVDSGDNPDTAGNNGDSGNNPDTSANPDTSTPPDSGNFDPSTVPGLVLWLDAGKNITNSSGTSISKWGDRTSHKNDAAQSVANRQPTAVASGINGLPTVHFNKGAVNGNGQMLLIPNNSDTSLEWGHQDFYLAVVARYDNDPADGNSRGVGVFFTKFAGGSSASNSGVLLTGNIPGNPNASQGLIFLTSLASGDSAVSTTKYWDNTPHIFTAQRVGKALTLAVDGVTVGSAGSSSQNDVSNTALGVRIGADGDANTLRLDGDISEEMAVKGTLASSDQAGIEAYLKAKYAL